MKILVLAILKLVISNLLLAIEVTKRGLNCFEHKNLFHLLFPSNGHEISDNHWDKSEISASRQSFVASLLLATPLCVSKKANVRAAPIG